MAAGLLEPAEGVGKQDRRFHLRPQLDPQVAFHEPSRFRAFFCVCKRRAILYICATWLGSSGFLDFLHSRAAVVMTDRPIHLGENAYTEHVQDAGKFSGTAVHAAFRHAAAGCGAA